jgi:hypothetical protein
MFFLFLPAEVVLKLNKISLVLRNGEIVIAPQNDALIEVYNETLARLKGDRA